MRPSHTPIIDVPALEARVNELAAEITGDYTGCPLHLLVVLKGGFIFAADLSRALRIPHTLDFIRATSYTGTESSGQPEITWTGQSLTDLHVLLVEDILDTGLTAVHLLQWVQAQHPASLNICTLLDKPARRKVPIAAHYTGFTIPDHFVIGYGLDHDQHYRHLPAIHTLQT